MGTETFCCVSDNSAVYAGRILNLRERMGQERERKGGEGGEGKVGAGRRGERGPRDDRSLTTA